MRINKSLNFVIPIVREDSAIYVHSIPLNKEVFETHFLILSKTFAAIYASGLGPMAAPRVAKLLMKSIATDLKIWEGRAGVENTLIAEIHRLSCIIVPSERGGWETIPFFEALRRDLLDEDELSEAENAIVFFIVASAMHKKTELRPVLEGAIEIWGGQLSSLMPTAFAASLPKLTGAAATPTTIAATPIAGTDPNPAPTPPQAPQQSLQTMPTIDSSGPGPGVLREGIDIPS